MINSKFYFLLILLLSNLSFCFNKNILPNDTVKAERYNLKYFGKNFFVIEGTKIHDSLKESPYDRLPFSYKKHVRKPVWDLSKSSAGLSIRFISNSSSISAKWEVLNNNEMNHMPDTGIKGIDLYYKTCLLYTSPSPRDRTRSRMPSSA